MYKLCKDILTGKTVDGVIRATDGACIPFDPTNTDYVEYMRWLAEGNEPLPADDQSWQNAPST